MSIAMQTRLRERAAELAEIARTHNIYAEPEGFRYISIATVCDKHLRPGRHLMVIAPYDPAGWPQSNTKMIFDHDNALDSEGRTIVGCVELEGLAFEPNGGTAPVLEDRLLTPALIARAAGIVRARVRSGQLRGFTLTRLPFGIFYSPYRGDLPALIADMTGVEPGEPPVDEASLIGERLCPAAIRTGRSPQWSGNVYLGALTPADLDAVSRLRIVETAPDWRRPASDWVPIRPRHIGT